MDGTHFDAIVTRISRRAAGRGIFTGLALAALTSFPGRSAVANVTTEGTGCRNVGKTCKRSAQCCSGICSGKKGKKKNRKKCRAHGAGTCAAGADYCSDGDTTGCNGYEVCHCFQTTGGASFCGLATEPNTVCAACRVDTDCDAITGPGSACIPASQKPFCACEAEGFATACSAPCVV